MTQTMTQTTKTARIALLVLAASMAGMITGATGAEAKNRSRPFEIALRFIPGDDIGSSAPELPSGVTDRPVRLTLTDGRSEDDPALVGESSDDDDKMWPARATNDAVAWAHDALQKTVSEWGVKPADNAPLILAVKLTALKLEESNKAVGSTFHAEVKFAATLKNSKGATLWDGTAFGDATRYGKSRSEENANEVFSDALIEAAADLLGNEDLQGAWAGNGSPRAAAFPSASSSASSADAARVTPAALLAELVKLKKQGFDTDLLVDYVNKKTLTNELSSDDLVKWKQAGMPEAVIKAALAR